MSCQKRTQTHSTVLLPFSFSLRKNLIWLLPKNITNSSRICALLVTLTTAYFSRLQKGVDNGTIQDFFKHLNYLIVPTKGDVKKYKKVYSALGKLSINTTSLMLKVRWIFLFTFLWKLCNFTYYFSWCILAIKCWRIVIGLEKVITVLKCLSPVKLVWVIAVLLK